MFHLFLSLSLSEAVSVLKTDNQASWSSSAQFLGLPIGRAGDDSFIFANISSYCCHSLHVIFVLLGFAKMRINQTIDIQSKEFNVLYYLLQMNLPICYVFRHVYDFVKGGIFCVLTLNHTVWQTHPFPMGIHQSPG